MPARQTTEHFLRIYGAVLGDFVLIFDVRGGIFLTDGERPRRFELCSCAKITGKNTGKILAASSACSGRGQKILALAGR